jgi:hypothetical protein
MLFLLGGTDGGETAKVAAEVLRLDRRQGLRDGPLLCARGRIAEAVPAPPPTSAAATTPPITAATSSALRTRLTAEVQERDLAVVE